MVKALELADILNFWFNEIDPKFWFQNDPSFDKEIHRRFSEVHAKATRGELKEWRETPEGRLAEIIILDQFSRNIFRGTAQAFASDEQALSLAKEAIRGAADKQLSDKQKPFLYMPFMHSESARDHETAVQLFSQPGFEYNLKYEMAHKKIVDRFGRYPHRNESLGRTSTAEEVEFLKEKGSSF